MASEYLAPSDTDDSSENEEVNYLVNQNDRVTEVSNLDEPPNGENVVYSQWVPFLQISTFQGKSFAISVTKLPSKCNCMF